jgi:hypothetical protein
MHSEEATLKSAVIQHNMYLGEEYCDKPRASHIELMIKYFAVQPLLS